MKPIASIAALFAALFVVSSASAREDFPNQMHGYLSLDYLPPCSVCHIDGVTDQPTLVTPFGQAIRNAGAQGRQGVTNALASLRAAHTDSDGDGVSDVDELIAGTDPNSSANGSLRGEQASAGCAVGAPSSSASPVAAVAALLTAVFLGLRSSRKCR